MSKSNRNMMLMYAGAAAFAGGLATAALGAGAATQPNICSRSCWGSRSTGTPTEMSTLNRAIIHHTAGASDYNVSSVADSKAKVRAVQNIHMDGNGWADIGYHFVFDKLGNAFEGRRNSLDKAKRPRGAHDSVNDNSFGFSNLGYYHSPYNNTLTNAQKQMLYDVIAWRMPNGWSPYGSGSYGGNTVGYLDGHRKVTSTACPGDLIYNTIIGSNYSSGEARAQIWARIQGSAGGGSKYAPMMLYKASSATSYLWDSNGSSFTLGYSETRPVSYNLDNVGQHMVATDATGDGVTDLVTAYQYPDGTIQLHVWNGGSATNVSSWFQSGSFAMASVAGRMVGGDFNGDGKGDVAMLYRTGAGSMTIFRFLSNGSAFTYDSTSITGFELDNVADHATATDLNNDGKDDIVTAYQYPDGTMKLHVWINGQTSNWGIWFNSGTFSMAAVAGRMAGGDFNGDGKGDVAMFYDTGSGSFVAFRFLSNGSNAFSYDSTTKPSGYTLANVANHFAAGDADGDGDDDIVTAYQYGDGTFSYHVWFNGQVTSVGTWYDSGSFSLANVGGRMVMGK
jgi:hypothetical protein